MYNKFFGFKEKPFKLVPNPEYLFLSKSHEEALGHLTYAILHGDGFVEITGEVGTGKTTLCRVFLEGLDKSIEAAYIFNPKLDAMQLLKAINDEFGIDSKPDNTKDLIDILNGFLIEKKAAGQKVLVLIDEAQNLSLEVLEQLRLLSNLETTQEKLLQIILVGQPELGDMLSSHQLRQLGQRITINCQLDPLTFQEAMDYIRHRISLASHRAGPPFDKSSYRAIYEYSRGIPRLINIACDRVLLNAFSRNSFKITGSITKEAIKELTRKKSGSSYGWLQRAPSLVILSAVLTSLTIILLHLFNGQPFETQVPREDQISAQVANELHQEELQEIKKVHEPEEPVVSQSSEPPVLQSEASLSGQPPEVLKNDNSKETATLAEIAEPPEPVVSQSSEPPVLQSEASLSGQPSKILKNDNSKEATSLAEVLELSDHSPKGLSQPPGLPESDVAGADNIPVTIDIHTVHAGTFQSASQAIELVEELKALGYPSFMYMKTREGKTEYIVVAGKYQSYTPAKKASLKLNNNGYNNFIAKAKDSLKRGPAILINQQPVGSDAGKEDAN